jgi:hypothetical protein
MVIERIGLETLLESREHICQQTKLGFPEQCEGCPHIVTNKCMYLTEPRLRKFPCFFKEHIKAGGYDGQYGATVDNYKKAAIPDKRKAKSYGRNTVIESEAKND